MSTRGGRRATPALAVTLLLLLAAPALADDRFAAVGGDGAFPCTSGDPCPIETAVSTAQSGDLVNLFAGTYSVSSTLELPVGVSMFGSDATINSTAATGIRVVASSPESVSVSRIKLNHTPTGGSPSIGLEQLAGSSSGLIVTSSGDQACAISGTITAAIMRESICHNTSNTAGSGVASVSAVDSLASIYEVTAISDNGNALFASATAPNADVSLIGGNVIASGVTDQRGFNSSTTSTTSDIDLAYSNFDTLDFSPPTGATGTLSTENNNQSAPPQLDSSFHQLPGSPTINAGNTFLQSAFVDVDGDDRPQGAAMDIGADEVEGVPPETTIDAKPPRRTRKRTARFRFSSSEPDDAIFECKIDAKPFRPCESPAVYRNLKRGRRHTFRVQATDGFLNTDDTPAAYSWKVRR